VERSDSDYWDICSYVENAITQIVGEQNFQVIYSSAHKNVVCYGARATSSQATELRDNGFIQYVYQSMCKYPSAYIIKYTHYLFSSAVAVPQEMKLDSALLKLFEEDTKDNHADKFVQVQFGIGSVKALHDIDMPSSIQSWLNR